jgi:WXG100 family type VII secretion target
MAEIKLSYEQLTSSAADIKTFAGQVREVMQLLSADVVTLITTWDGEARKAFDESYVAGEKEMRHFPTMLDELHAALTFAAESMRTAELASAEATAATVQADTA